MTKIETGSQVTGAPGKAAASAKVASPNKKKSDGKSSSATKAGGKAKASTKRKAKSDDSKPIVVKHQSVIPEGLPKKYFTKSTFNTHDIMHAPVEKTLQMLDKILSGERLFTM